MFYNSLIKMISKNFQEVCGNVFVFHCDKLTQCIQWNFNYVHIWIWGIDYPPQLPFSNTNSSKSKKST